MSEPLVMDDKSFNRKYGHTTTWVVEKEYNEIKALIAPHDLHFIERFKTKASLYFAHFKWDLFILKTKEDDGVVTDITPILAKIKEYYSIKNKTLGDTMDKEIVTVIGKLEHPTISFLKKSAEIMPDGSLGAVYIGEFAGDRSKDLRLTFAQARTLAEQITRYVGD